MWHIEFYVGTTEGALKVVGNTNNPAKNYRASYKYLDNLNFQRRNDLIDPMGILNLPKIK